jgi:hypothetical protein
VGSEYVLGGTSSAIVTRASTVALALALLPVRGMYSVLRSIPISISISIAREAHLGARHVVAPGIASACFIGPSDSFQSSLAAPTPAPGPAPAAYLPTGDLGVVLCNSYTGGTHEREWA